MRQRDMKDTMYKINTHLGVDQLMDTQRWMPYDINAISTVTLCSILGNDFVYPSMQDVTSNW